MRVPILGVLLLSLGSPCLCDRFLPFIFCPINKLLGGEGVPRIEVSSQKLLLLAAPHLHCKSIELKIFVDPTNLCHIVVCIVPLTPPDTQDGIPSIFRFLVHLVSLVFYQSTKIKYP